MAYELKTGGVLLHPIFGGGKEKDKYVCLSHKSLQGVFFMRPLIHILWVFCEAQGQRPKP